MVDSHRYPTNHMSRNARIIFLHKFGSEHCGEKCSVSEAPSGPAAEARSAGANLMQLVASWCQNFMTKNMVAAAVLGHAGVDEGADGESDGDAEARDDTTGAADPSKTRGRGHCGGAVSDDEDGEENDY